MKYVAIGVLTLLLLFVSTTSAVGPSKPQNIPDSAFKPVTTDRIIRDMWIRYLNGDHFQPHVTLHPVPMVIKLTLTDPKKYALSRIGSVQFACLDKLWTRESHWNPLDLNKSSGAYGIPQALPGDKMAVMGADWRTNPITQVRWGLMYIRARYGNACGAWNHSEQYGWY